MSDDIKTESDKKNKKIYRRVGLVIGIIIIFICIALNYFTKNSLYNGKIADNIFVQGVEISQMGKEEAIEAVNKKYKPQNLNLSYEKNNYEINCEDIELKYNTEELVEQAYNSTRTGSYFNDIASYISVTSEGKKYTIKATYNEEKLDKSIEKIAKDINQDAKNATVSVGGGISITPSKTGLKFETKENKKLIEEALNNKKYDTIDLKVSVTKPRISTEDVSSINTTLASFSTTFNSALVERSYNIGLSAQRVSNVILKPGETFSYNEHTGMRLLSNGYLNAPVIVGNDYEDAPGGGVCQTSTTLFNAALLSGLQIDQVRNHSKTSQYVPRGRDAMVNDGDSDLKFTNNFDHAVYIQCYRSGSSVVAAIYGASQDRVGVNIRVDNFTYNGLPGAKTYRTITKNGKSKTSYIYTSVYRK
ncbi:MULTISPECIES: VanW family protein [Terrisporobacter]|uniref:VanW family protein n=1 Tax=Terrisporobacter muris TaxID=2963284 RepID=A0A9X2MC01_9FIRM|nr:VanW family protein [Terrisporobacter othiniensis]MCR1823489.1 VanW family protein [Terrisporobacter muris]MDU6983508.1 VanW family protein [Terrisporobacter othiniensis]MDY3374580.1 VanW family protein [Terrisporobacter othiniensis]